MSIIDLILDWRVTDDILTSDHRCISFRINLKRPPVKPYRNRKSTNWELFSREIEPLLPIPGLIKTGLEIDSLASSLTSAITCAFDKACPLIANQKSRNKPFWCSDLKKLRKSARRLKNLAKRTNNMADWVNFLVAQKNYKKSLRNAHRASWINFCEEINSLSGVARLNKALAKNELCRPDVLRRSDGNLTSSYREVGEVLLSVYFPECDIINSDNVAFKLPKIRDNAPNWDAARRIVNSDVLRWSIFSFAPFKTGGPDEVFPAELQHGFPLIRDHLTLLFQASIAFSYVPQSWSRSKVVFIPKAGRPDYTDPKAFRPISLSSTFLKVLERIIDRFIRDGCLSLNPLSDMQHAYRVGKSCETALHELVTRIERSLEFKEIVVGTFLDIAGAFDSTSFLTIIKACENFGVDHDIVLWIESMLKSRTVEMELADQTVSVTVTKGCPQGGVLSPLLWLLVIDELLVNLKHSGFVVQGYADDLVLTVSGKHLSTLTDLTQHALWIIEAWCLDKGLYVNPQKTDLVVFSRRRNTENFIAPLLFGKAIDRSVCVKHLGVYLDSKLSWKQHLDSKLLKATAIFWQCRRAFGKTWGLTPKTLLLIYKSMVLPMLSYASIVWWPVVKLKASIAKLSGLQGTACRAITGSMSSTPLIAMEAILSMPQLHSFILGTACSAAFRLKCLEAWNVFGSNSGHREILSRYSSHIPEIDMVNDRLLPEFNFSSLFSVEFPSRDLWVSQVFQKRLSESVVFFSDGSRSELSAGFGIHCPSLVLNSSGCLGSYCTVFQAELIALTHCVFTALKYNFSEENIIMCTDSKAVLDTLINPLTVSKLVKDCKLYINRLCVSNRVSLIWVPAHCNIEGNEIADSLAKAGSRSKLIGPEPATPLSVSLGKQAIKNFILLDSKRIWRATSGCRWAKYFISEPSMRLTKYAVSLKKDQLRILTGILTGHGHFKDLLHRMGLAQDNLCEDCLEEVDDCIHFVCSCPAFERVRLQVFNARSIELDQLSSLPWFKLVQFAKVASRTCT